MVDMEALALQIYNGKVQAENACDSVIEDNRNQLKEFSCRIAEANKSFFIEKLKQKLTSDEFCRINSVDGLNEKPYTDRYGRCTHFFVAIASKKFWLFQPGTVMLDCGVSGDLEVCHGGSQQNGPILGNGCASYLARFAANLAKKYEQKSNQDTEFNKTAFKKSLTETLEEMVEEDATQHGRLISVKDQLMELSEDKKLTAQQLALIYAKDILTLRQLDVHNKESYTHLLTNPPSEQEIKSFGKKRLELSKFNRPGLFDYGKVKIQDEFQKIIDALVSKDGLVPDDVKDLFRNNLKNWKPGSAGLLVAKPAQSHIITE